MNLDNRQKMIAGAAVLVAILVASTYVVIGLGGGDDDGDGLKEYTGYFDAMGNTLKMETQPSTIISTAPSLTELLWSLGYGNQIVAVSDFTSYPQEAVERLNSTHPNHTPSMGSYWEPNTEMITNLSADVVFMTKTSGSVSIYESLKDAGENVVMLHVEESYVDIYRNIEMVLKVMHPVPAMLDMKNSVESVKEKMSNGAEDRQILMHLGWWNMDDDVYSVGYNTFIDDAAKMSKVTKNTADIDGFAMISKEFFLDDNTNPDIIISFGFGAYTDWDDLMKDLRDDDIWGGTNAVKNDEVYVFTGRAEDIASRAAPQAYGDFVKLMAMILQPQLFDDFEPPKTVGNDYADLFVGHW